MERWRRCAGASGQQQGASKGGEWGGPIAKNHGPDKMDALAAAEQAAADQADAARVAILATQYGEAVAALQGALYGMQAALSRLKADGRLDEGGPVASFKERQRMVNKPFFDAQEKRYTNDTA